MAVGAMEGPGPDDIPIGFYKEHWDLVGQNITNILLSFLNGHFNLLTLTQQILF